MTYLTEERRLIQDSAREFAMREVMPIANKLDPEKGDIPMSLREKMAEMGYFGILIPEEYGGLGLGCFEYCIVAEELSKAWMSVASLMARANGLVGMPVMTDEQRRNYLSRMARGEFIGCVAISEPDVGSDVSGIACRARRDGDSWVINGNKYWCTFADGADFMILMARTSEPTNPKRRHEAERVTSDALQLLGGAGYTTLHPVERFRRDARLTKIFEGTSEIQLRIISDRLLA